MVAPPHAEHHDRCSLPGLAGLAGQRWQKQKLGSIDRRRERDSNPRYLLGTHDFQSCTFDHSVISPWKQDQVVSSLSGGGHGIRTHVTLTGKPDFESGALNHSANPPRAKLAKGPGVSTV